VQPQPVTPTAEQPKTLKCSDCAGEIKAVKIGDTEYTAESVAAAARRNYKLDLCAECQRKRRAFERAPAHSDQAPIKISNGRLINATEKRAFWSAVKVGMKTEQQIRDYFATLGIKDTAEMPQSSFSTAMEWACRAEKAVQS
jgi:formylmethanofuran dehydrogenase subunit A